METQALPLGTAEVRFAKVVATPSPLSWSQIYNAGTLFAVLSLNFKEIAEGDVPILSIIGKDVFNALEEEYFTLETKSFLNIKEAITKCLEKIPASAFPTLLVAAIPPGKEEILYVYGVGKGSILLKRGDTTGPLLENSDELQSASGILEDKDILILQTEEFSNAIPRDTLVSSLDLPPSDVAEVFAAKIHQDEMGKEAALILSYHKKQPHQEELVVPFLPTEPQTEVEAEIPPLSQSQPESVFPTLEMTKPPSAFNTTIFTAFAQKLLTQTRTLQLNHTKKVFLTVAVILSLALIGAAYLAIQNQQETKRDEQVAKVLQEAEKKYNEGQVLAGLNKNLAHEDFVEAQKILETAKPTFPKGSKQEKQINDLLAKVTSSLTGSSDTMQLPAQEVSVSTSPLLSSIQSKKALYASTYEANTFYLAKDGVYSLNGSTSEKKIEKDLGTSPKGIGAFGSNLYILDSAENQIYKFVPSGNSYSRSNYLTDEHNLSSAVSMSIDGSIWILLKDGGVKKFTKGKQDPLSLSGLPTPLSNPTRIFTNADSTSLYILDPNNKRIVSFAKNGTYQEQYQADVIKNATDFDIQEKDKKAYILSQNKVYELPLP